MAQRRFLHLLIALLLLILVAPVARYVRTSSGFPTAPIIATILFAALLVTAVFAVSRRRGVLLATGLLAGAAILLQVVNLTVRSDLIFVIHHILSLCFLASVVVMILRFLFTMSRVSFDAICASLCVYLLLGVLWAVAYSLLELMVPASFASSASAGAADGLIRFGGDHTDDALYFSFVTLTTLGYGDITPVAPMGRMLAVIEALTGQIYLVVLVARLVGLHVSQGTRRPIAEDGKE